MMHCQAAGAVTSSAEVLRITFTEVTRKAVLDAMAHPRAVSIELVDAYRACRALDYLIGFHLSPLLWKKLPSARSAGLELRFCISCMLVVSVLPSLTAVTCHQLPEPCVGIDLIGLGLAPCCSVTQQHIVKIAYCMD